MQRLASSQVVVGLLTLLAGFLALHPLASTFQDVGRHIRLGEIISQTESVPDTNLFSFTAPTAPFHNHHWLYEVVAFWMDYWFGLESLIWLSAFLLAGSFGLALMAAYDRSQGIVVPLVALVALVVLSERTDVRPEMVSFLFLGWFLYVLYRTSESRLVWTLPVVQVLWVNTHIYFFMGPFVALAWLLGRVVDEGFVVERLKRALLVVALTLSVLVINPDGLRGALYPFTVLDQYGYTIVENKSPAFLKDFGYPQTTVRALYVGILLALGALIAGFRSRSGVYWQSLALLVGTSVLALVMVRNFPLFALVLVPAVGCLIRPTTLWSLGRAQMPWVVGILMLVGASIVTGQFSRDMGFGHPFGVSIPQSVDDVARFWHANGLRGPVFNNFDIGSYLIWKIPQEPVFVDGRPEAYPVAFFQEVYIPMQEDPAVWERYRLEYGLNAIIWNARDITPWSQTFVARIRKDPTWAPVYDRDGVLILLYRNEANAETIARLEVTKTRQ